MKAMPSLSLSSCVLGQYVADYDSQDPYAKKGYKDDPTVRLIAMYVSIYVLVQVPAGSSSPTFAAALLKINNERWEGVPFLLKAGKALNERKVEVSKKKVMICITQNLN